MHQYCAMLEIIASTDLNCVTQGAKEYIKSINNCVTPLVPQQVPKLLLQIYFPGAEQQDQVAHFVFPKRLPLLKSKHLCHVLYTVAVLFLLSQQLVHGQIFELCALS